jgi:hypothetical protein
MACPSGRRGTSRSSAFGGKVAVGQTVVCEVLVAEPNAPTVTTVNFTETDGTPGQGVDAFQATGAGDGEIRYTLINNGASIEFRFKYKIVAAV